VTTIDAGAAAPHARDTGRALERTALAAILLVEAAWIGGLSLLAVHLL
jgi:hypothetical protein